MSGLDEWSLNMIQPAGVFPLCRAVWTGGAVGSGATSLTVGAGVGLFWVVELPGTSAMRGVGVDFGWVAAEKLAGWVWKKATVDGNWKQRKLMRELWNTFVSSIY
ncbi:hypothetical protein V6N13_074324 [Hibiscus sabdariffa]